jgi:hypothetical protein
MPPALLALAPVIASGVGSLLKHKQAGAAQKQQLEMDKREALAAEAARKAEFEAAQSSPGALQKRQSFTMQLGKLLGKAGGKDKLPPSIYNYLQTQRTSPNYVAGAAYQAPPKKGGGVWDFLGGATEALSYLDTSKLKGKPRPTQMSGFGTGSSFTPQTQVRTALAQSPGSVKPLVTDLTRTPWRD